MHSYPKKYRLKALSLAVLAAVSSNVFASDIEINEGMTTTLNVSDEIGGRITVNAPITPTTPTTPTNNGASIVVNGINIVFGAWTIINNSDIVTSGGSAAVYAIKFKSMASPLMVINNGIIKSSGSCSFCGSHDGIFAPGALLTVVNNAGAEIKGEASYSSGIVADSLNLKNDGVITGVGAGVHSNATDNTTSSVIENSGLIHGDSGYGIFQMLADSYASIVNKAGGVISSTAAAAIRLYSNTNSTNATGDDTVVYIDNQEGATITGTAGVSYDMLSVHKNNLIVDLNNDGLIKATVDDALSGVGGTIRNTGNGIIDGASIGIHSSQKAAEVYNSGTIIGGSGIAIQFSQRFAYDNTLTLDTGSVINGGVIGGMGTDTLILHGRGEEDGVKFTNFDILNVNGESWTFNSALSLSEGVNVNSGVLITDSIITTPQVNIMQSAGLIGAMTVAGNVDNAGAMAPAKNGASFSVMTIDGDYQGSNGSLYLNTRLGSDDSATDKLVVKGNTAGNTYVSINNAGGTGAATINGIEIIHVEGQSDGEFSQSGRIVAGAYDYSLKRGLGSDSSNWYLVSAKTPKEDTPVIRPEAGSYMANLVAANTLFITRLHDRLGETQYTDALTGEQKVTSMWLRQVGGHNNWRDSSGQLKTQSNRYVLQMGGDIASWSQDGLERLHLGAMAGYAHSSSNTRSSVNGYGADGSVNGYSVGLYGTWYANDETQQGTYLDSWAQYNWFNNHVRGERLSVEPYGAKGITASLEVGYTHQLGEFTGSKGSTNAWYLQPQAQAIWMGVEASDYKEVNGTRVSGKGDGNIQTRLGVRTFLKGHHESDEGKDREFEPFIEANWIHNTHAFGTQMNGVTIEQSGARNLAEIKTGVEGKLNKNINLWGNVGIQVGDQGYNDASAMIGIKYSFK